MLNYLQELYDDLIDWWNGGTDDDDPPPTPITDPADDGGDTPVAPIVQPCPFDDPESDQKKSLYIDIGWTFSSGSPEGTYDLTIAGLNFTGALASGHIRLDEELDSLCGSGSLRISVTDGPVFEADVVLDLPNVHTIAGLKRRLTNLGLYAGTDTLYDDRATWAVRAFKRKAINGYEHNATLAESNEINTELLTGVRDAYGAHPGDDPTATVADTVTTTAFVDAGLFGNQTLKRGGFEDTSLTNDRDPSGAGNNGIWASASAQGVTGSIAGNFTLHLRAFDPHAGDPVMHNRINLPQHVHMAQFVLFELGYWVVGGSYAASGTGPTQTKRSFTPDGGFGPNTQWAVREFQCYAKFPNVAREDVASADNRYLPRLFAASPTPNDGAGRYANNGRVSGALNPATRAALQHWADQRRRCPVIVYASTDTASTVANGSDMTRLVKENLWKHDDHADGGPRMFAIDYGGYYSIPATHGGTVTVGGATFPRPIVIGGYTAPTGYQGGPVSLPRYGHVWASAQAEVRPDTLVATTDPGDGSTLTAAQLSTFKVVRTAAHFECLGYFDALNAYDDVVISFGPCHWTLARGTGTGARDEAREMPALLAFFDDADAAAYDEFFGRFGLQPAGNWPLTMAAATGTYNTRIEIQTESGTINLSGVHGTAADGRRENTYCKTWHSYYRFQMACRTSNGLRDAMWGFTRVRVQDILDKTFTINGTVRRVGDLATSEKSVGMLLRWHIFRPAHLFRATNNHLQTALTNLLAGTYPNNDAREQALIDELVARANAAFGAGTGLPAALDEIRGWTNVPQTGTRSYYALALADPVLNATAGSFDFEAP